MISDSIYLVNFFLRFYNSFDKAIEIAMLKWKGHKKSVMCNQQRKSIQFGSYLQKKTVNDRFSSKKYPDRRSVTESDEIKPRHPLVNLSNPINLTNVHHKKSSLLKYSENYRFLSGKKKNTVGHQIRKKQSKVLQMSALEFKNHASMTNCELNSKMMVADKSNSKSKSKNKKQIRWKKSKIKDKLVNQKLKQMQKFMKTRQQTQPHQYYERYTKKICETEGQQADTVRLKSDRLKKQRQKRKQKNYYHEQKSDELGTNFIERLKNEEFVMFEVTEAINVKELQTFNKIGAGTFGQVYNARDKKSGKKYAIKTIFNDKTHKNREISIMNMLNSNFVIKKLGDYSTFHDDGEEEKEYIHIVMPQFDSNLYEYFKKNCYSTPSDLLKILFYQMFRGILYLHSRGICHRDLKPQNILIKSKRLVICDLGSAKILSPEEENISYICSRCYRAPELIFGYSQYSVSIDIWSAGCIILEFLNKNPLFIGKDSLHHLVEVIKVLGTPTKMDILNMNPFYDSTTFNLPKIKAKKWSQLFEKIDPNLQDLLNKIMIYDPSKRLTAGEVLCHDYFSDIRDKMFLEKVSRKYNIPVTDFFRFDTEQLNFINNPKKLIPSWFSN